MPRIPAFFPGAKASVGVLQPVLAVETSLRNVEQLRIDAGQPLETDLAQTATAVRSRTVGQPVETDTAQAATHAKPLTVGQALETDVANHAAPVKSGIVGQPAATD